jgi:hypothetical protein
MGSLKTAKDNFPKTILSPDGIMTVHADGNYAAI